MEIVLKLVDLVLDFLTLGRWSKRRDEERIALYKEPGE